MPAKPQMLESEEVHIRITIWLENVISVAVLNACLEPESVECSTGSSLDESNRLFLIRQSAHYIAKSCLLRLEHEDHTSAVLLNSVNVAQRLVRGFLGRRRFKRNQKIRESESESIVRNYYATEIQRHARGFLSRLHVSNFRRTKRFLADLVKVNAVTRSNLREREAENLRVRFIEMTVEERIRAAVKARQERFMAPTFSKTGFRVHTAPGRRRPW